MAEAKVYTATEKRHHLHKLDKDEEYIIWGLPFYNKNMEDEFDEFFTKSYQ